MFDPLRDSVWRSQVNGWLAFVCVGAVTLAAVFFVWRMLLGTDPLEQAFAKSIAVETQVL